MTSRASHIPSHTDLSSNSICVNASSAANRTDSLHFGAMISATDPVAVLLGDLCDVCEPGDEIELTGVYTHNYVIMANHIVVQDDRNAAEHLTDDDIKAINALSECADILGHRLLDEAALTVAPISDSPKPPPCRDIVAGIVAAGIVAAGIIEASLDGCNFPAANSWSGRQRS